MLAVRKPLAMFYAAVIELPNEEFIPEMAFAQYVSAKTMSRHSIELDSRAPSGDVLKLRYVFFALPGEEWRMPAMALLVQALNAGGGWNETCQRVEGALLGYTHEEIEAYCQASFRCERALPAKSSEPLSATAEIGRKTA